MKPVQCICGRERSVETVYVGGGETQACCCACGIRSPAASTDYGSLDKVYAAWDKMMLALKSHDPLVKALKERTEECRQSAPPVTCYECDHEPPCLARGLLALVEDAK